MFKKLVLIGFIAMTFQSCCYNGSCDDEGDPPFESLYEPIYMQRSLLEERVTLENVRPVEDAGKIYVFGDLLLINDKHKGFHVFRNDDPTTPEVVSFLDIPGATDISIRDGVYYVNQAVDLIAISFDIRSNTSLVVSKRIREVFPELRSPEGEYAYDKPAGAVVVGWKLKSED